MWEPQFDPQHCTVHQAPLGVRPSTEPGNFWVCPPNKTSRDDGTNWRLVKSCPQTAPASGHICTPLPCVWQVQKEIKLGVRLRELRERNCVLGKMRPWHCCSLCPLPTLGISGPQDHITGLSTEPLDHKVRMSVPESGLGPRALLGSPSLLHPCQNKSTRKANGRRCLGAFLWLN